jgi:pyruvate dehydrogenase E1 component alpha subunit
MIAELYGKEAGCSRGAGGSMHLVDWDCGFAGSTSIVGGTIPVGVGLAFADKLRGSSRITAIMIGDAALEEGVFHESANFASLHKLNVLFVVEDNDRSCYTKKHERQPNRSLNDVFWAHDIPSVTRYCETANHVARETVLALKNRMPGAVVFYANSKVEHCGPKLENGYQLGYQDPKHKREIDEAIAWARALPL